MKKLLLFVFSLLVFSPLLSKAQCSLFPGNDQVMCWGTSIVYLNASANQYTTFAWSTSGTGTFSESNKLLSTYTPSAADATNGPVYLTITATGGSCGTLSSALKLTLYPWPTIEVGLDKTICGSSGSTILLNGITDGVSISWGSSGTGTFSPNSQTANVVYTPSEADITSGSVMLFANSTSAQACNSAMDDLIVTILPKVIINAGSDQTICAGNSIVLSSASAVNASTFTWTTSGSGTFTNSTSLQTTYQPSAADIAAGTVTLTLTGISMSACSESDNIKVPFFNSGEQVNAGPDQVVAAGFVTLLGSTVGTNSVVWTSDGTGSFTNNAVLQTMYAPSNADIEKGFVKIKLTSTSSTLCDPAEDEMIATLGNDLTLSGTINAGANAVDKAVVLLFKQQTSTMQFIKSDTITVSDNGAYSFDHVPDGAYVLLASPITGSSFLNTYLPTYSGGTQTWNTAESVSLDGSNGTYNISLAAYTSADASWNTGADIITGSVDIPVSAAANARVQTSSSSASYVIVYLTNAAGNKIAYTQTDKDGRYSFRNVKQGVYYIVPEFGGTALAGTATSVPVTTDGSASTTSDASFSLEARTSSTTGILNTTTSKHILAYPNPAKNSVSIDMNMLSGTGEVKLLNQTGIVQLQQPVTFDKKTITLNIESLPAGIYILQLVAENEIYTSKIVKQ